MIRSVSMRTAALAVATAIIASCAEPVTSTLQPVETYLAHQSSGATLVECPVDQTTTASGLITPLGGVVSAGGTSISVPAGAVLVPTTITLTIPASNYMEIDIKADGAEHFNFQLPVSISVDYSRCTRTNINKGPLSVWYIDSATKALLESMGGVDDKAARKVTFSTDHLSGYAIAN